ncbi:hypothetical protein ACP6JC_006418 [Aspergillus fumigatus]
MILTGLGGIILIEIYAAVMQREFQNTNNRVGKGFAILGIYIETKQKTLEEIAASFGDKVILPEDQGDQQGENDEDEDEDVKKVKPNSQQIEVAVAGRDGSV